MWNNRSFLKPSGPDGFTHEDVDALAGSGLQCEQDVTRRALEEPPLLAVEVHTAVTRSMDQYVKREVYQESGVASYWTFDPAQETLTVLELVDGQYVERAVVEGDAVFETDQPFVPRVVPGELV